MICFAFQNLYTIKAWFESQQHKIRQYVKIEKQMAKVYVMKIKEINWRDAFKLHGTAIQYVPTFVFINGEDG